MKKAFFTLLLIVFLSVSLNPIAHAMEILSIDDKYDVYLFCTEDAGDYCDGNEIITDEFYFDDGEFTTEWFEDQLWGFNEPGEYHDSGIFVSGDYEVYSEAAEKYEVDFVAIGLMDGIISGTMDIKFYEWDFIKFDFEKENDATAYFLGIRK